MSSVAEHLRHALSLRRRSVDAVLIAAVIAREPADGDVDLDLWSAARRRPADDERTVRGRYVRLRAAVLRREMRSTMDALAAVDAEDRERQAAALRRWLADYRQTPEGRLEHDRVLAAAQWGTLGVGLWYWLTIGLIALVALLLSMR